jgi:hypothetical protein
MSPWYHTRYHDRDSFDCVDALAPDLMTAEERLREAAQILAGAVLRLRRREFQKHGSRLEKNGLDFSPDRSVHATARQRRKVRR